MLWLLLLPLPAHNAQFAHFILSILLLATSLLAEKKHDLLAHVLAFYYSFSCLFSTLFSTPSETGGVGGGGNIVC